MLLPRASFIYISSSTEMSVGRLIKCPLHPIGVEYFSNKQLRRALRRTSLSAALWLHRSEMFQIFDSRGSFCHKRERARLRRVATGSQYALDDFCPWSQRQVLSNCCNNSKPRAAQFAICEPPTGGHGRVKNEHFGHVEMLQLPQACSLRCHADNFSFKVCTNECTYTRKHILWDADAKRIIAHQTVLTSVVFRFRLLLFSDSLSKWIHLFYLPPQAARQYLVRAYTSTRPVAVRGILPNFAVHCHGKYCHQPA